MSIFKNPNPTPKPKLSRYLGLESQFGYILKDCPSSFRVPSPPPLEQMKLPLPPATYDADEESTDSQPSSPDSDDDLVLPITSLAITTTICCVISSSCSSTTCITTSTCCITSTTCGLQPASSTNINARERELMLSEQALIENNGALDLRAERLTQGETALKEKQVAFEEKEKALSLRESSLKPKEQELKEFELRLKEKEENLNLLIATTNQKEQSVQTQQRIFDAERLHLQGLMKAQYDHLVVVKKDFTNFLKGVVAEYVKVDATAVLQLQQALPTPTLADEKKEAKRKRHQLRREEEEAKKTKQNEDK